MKISKIEKPRLQTIRDWNVYINMDDGSAYKIWRSPATDNVLTKPLWKAEFIQDLASRGIITIDENTRRVMLTQQAHHGLIMLEQKEKLTEEQLFIFLLAKQRNFIWAARKSLSAKWHYFHWWDEANGRTESDQFDTRQVNKLIEAGLIEFWYCGHSDLNRQDCRLTDAGFDLWFNHFKGRMEVVAGKYIMQRTKD